MSTVWVAQWALLLLIVSGCSVTYPRPVSTHGSGKVIAAGIATDEDAELRALWVNDQLVTASTVDGDSIEVAFRSDSLRIHSRVRISMGPDATWVLARSGDDIGVVNYRDLGDSVRFRVRMVDVARRTVERVGRTEIVPHEVKQVTWVTFSESAGAHSMLRFESREGEIGEVDTDTTVFAVMSLPDLRMSGPHAIAVNSLSMLPSVYHGENNAFTLVYQQRDSLCDEPTEEKIRYVEGGILQEGAWTRFQFPIERQLEKEGFRTALVATTSGDQPVIWTIDICDSGIVRVSRFDRNGPSFRRGWSYNLPERESFVNQNLDWARAQPVGARVYEDGVLLAFEERSKIYTENFSPSMAYPPFRDPELSIPRNRFSDGRIQTTSLDSWSGLFESDGFAFFFLDFSGNVRWRKVIDRGGGPSRTHQKLGHSHADGLLSIGPAIGTRVPMVWRDMNRHRIVTASIDLWNGTISDIRGVVLLDDEAYWYARKWTPDGVLRSLTTIEGRETVPLIIDLSR